MFKSLKKCKGVKGNRIQKIQETWLEKRIVGHERCNMHEAHAVLLQVGDY